MEVTARSRVSVAACLLGFLVMAYQWWLGQGVEGAQVAPGGDIGLCLALILRALGGPWPLALLLWALCSLWSAALSGVPPFWLLLAGWPAWAVSSPGKKTSPASFIVGAAGVMALSRFGVKLLSANSPIGSVLTLSGTGPLNSLWAEFVPSLVFLSLFWGIMGALSADE